MTLRLDDPPPPQPCTSFPIPTPQDRLEGVSIYLVGLMGSGKSTVCEIFSRLGVPVLTSDDMAKELTSTDPLIREQLTALLGEEAYLPDRSLNRSFVGPSA